MGQKGSPNPDLNEGPLYLEISVYKYNMITTTQLGPICGSNVVIQYMSFVTWFLLALQTLSSHHQRSRADRCRADMIDCDVYDEIPNYTGTVMSLASIDPVECSKSARKVLSTTFAMNSLASPLSPFSRLVTTIKLDNTSLSIYPLYETFNMVVTLASRHASRLP
jgi:hypothetical protein